MTVLGLLGFGLFGTHEVVIADQIAHLMVCEQLVAAFHLPDCPVERTGGFFRIGNNRDQQMGYAIVNTKFNDLWIDHDKLDLVRSCLI